ncbi:hypothetical protein FRC17_008053 [Serendipita sp. 399]|nr:hypothetical protein FRC17_008053 [Serendipita sp. 399]
MSAAIHTNPASGGGWTHRLQGPGKRTGNTVQFRKTGGEMTPTGGAGGGANASFAGYSLNGAGGGGSRFEPGPTDTIDVIMRGMSGGIPGQRYHSSRYDEEAFYGMNTLSPVKDDVSDDTLSIGPLDTTTNANAVGRTTRTNSVAQLPQQQVQRRPSQALSLHQQQQPPYPQMEARRPSVPIIISPPGSRRPSAVEIDLSQARQRGLGHHRGEDSV